MFRVWNCYWKAERYKSPGIDEIPADLIQVESNVLRSELQKLTNSIGNKEELAQPWKGSVIVPI
jgi:hypothetical protein